MRLCRNFGVAWVVACLLFASNAYSQALPVFTGRMNASVGSLVKFKMARWGFAANDPRVTSTFTGVSSGLTTIAIGVATGAVATVGWPALLVAAGITAVASGAIALGADSLYKWIFNPDGTVTTNSPGTAGTPYGGNTWQDGQYANVIHLDKDCFPVKSGGSDSGRTISGIIPLKFFCQDSAGVFQTLTLTSAMLNGGSSSPTTVIASPASSASTIPASELAKPVSNEMLALAANAAWKAANISAGGLPWSASDPITPADVAQWKAENPSSVPTVSDLTAPVSNSSSVLISPSVTSNGSAAPATGPAATPGSGTKIDLGSDPNIGAPSLEATPTANAILSPLLNLMPGLKSFAVPAHTSVCPEPSFVALGSTYTFDSQCVLIEQNRTLIQAAMMLVWVLGSVFIVLRA